MLEFSLDQIEHLLKINQAEQKHHAGEADVITPSQDLLAKPLLVTKHPENVELEHDIILVDALQHQVFRHIFFLFLTHKGS